MRPSQDADRGRLQSQSPIGGPVPAGHATVFAGELAKIRAEAQQHPERFSW
ncbi:hypothetical protein [Microlunatus speluncae]|uniref:hypothetical protein n=1 Tax=Microlunatus speluncae TaxID=2594267 RepID=UPI0013756219|nr:hypothetical protein [Microlunatus speluncae]